MAGRLDLRSAEVLDRPLIAMNVFSEELQSWTKHLETLSFLEQFLFITSETELDYCHQKVNARVAERLKT